MAIHGDLTPQERARAALDGDWEAAGYPKGLVAGNGAQMRVRVKHTLGDPEEMNHILHRIAEGTSIAQLAREMSLDYSILYSQLKSKHWDRVMAAKAALAEEVAHKNLALADRVESGEVDATAGRTAAGIRQWYAERTAPDSFGQRSSMDVNVKGTVGLHLQAIRQVLSEDDIEDAEFEEIEPESYSEEPPGDEADVSDDHPLL